MKVYHEQFGTGQIISSTEKLDESGSIVSADVMFEHGIELEMPLFEVTYSAKKAAAGEDIGKPGKEFKKIAAKAAAKYGSKAAGGRVAGAVLKKLRKEETDLDEATKGQVKVNAADARVKKKIQKEKVGTDDRNSNLQWPLHRVKSKSYDEDDTPVTMHHYVRAADKHRAVAKVQLDLTKKGHQVGNVKHMGMMKEETEELDEKLIGKQHKIDANKNGKIDAEDFKKLRGKKDKADKKPDYEDESDDNDAAVNVAENVGKTAKESEAYSELIESLKSRIADIALHASGKTHEVIKNMADDHMEDWRHKLDVAHAAGLINKEQHEAGHAVTHALHKHLAAAKSVTDYNNRMKNFGDFAHSKANAARSNMKAESFDYFMAEEAKVTPATAEQRIPAVENTVREIMSQNRNLRQEAKIAEFKSRSE